MSVFQRLPWAAALIEAADGPVPRYGSPAWAALPDTSRAKIAAVVVAAECWREECDPEQIARRLQLELDATAQAEEWDDEDVASGARAAERRDTHLAKAIRRISQDGARQLLGRRPTHAELCDRRGELDRAERARVHERRLQVVPRAG